MACVDTFYAAADQLEAFLRTALPGSGTLYARGPALDPENPAVKLVRAWCDRGDAVSLKQRQGDGTLGHLVRRALPDAVRAMPARAVRSDLDAFSPEARLLVVLEELADSGAPLPSYSELAELADLPSRQSADYRLKLLINGGYVRVREAGGVKVGEILATGPRAGIRTVRA